MPWAQLDDQFHAHHKAAMAWQTRGALGLHLLAMSYCAGLLTDGFVHEAFVIGKLPQRREREKLTAALIDAGLWEHAEGGYRIHDWLNYNPSRQQIHKRRARDRDRKRPGFHSESATPPEGLPSPPLPRAQEGRGGEPEERLHGAGDVDARAPDARLAETVEILRQAPRLEFDPGRVGVANILAANPHADHLQAARLVVARVADPAYRTVSAARALDFAFADLRREAARGGRADERREARRARGTAALRTLMASTEEGSA